MKYSLERILILVSGINWTLVCINGHVPDEQLLFEYLMEGHQKSVRPVVNSSTVVLIKFALRLNQIIDLNERKQVLTTDLFIDQEWTDESLKWAPEDFNGITSLRASADEVWRPDTLIYNNADESTSGFLNGKYILLHHDGSVFWPVPLKLKSSCKVNIVLFPFDEQKCSVLFGSFAYDERWVNYITMRNDTIVQMDYYIRNTEWQLLSVTLEKCITSRDGCSEPKASISLRLRLRRNTFYYMANIIVPCIMLSVLMLFTFWLPPTSTEKIPMGLSVFLTFFMFMLLVAEEVPATSEEVPLIGIYLCVVMAMTSVSVILGVMVINIYNRGMKMRRAPFWVRRLILEKIAPAVRMRCNMEVLAKSIKLEDRYQDLVLRKDSGAGPEKTSGPEKRNSHSSNRRQAGETRGYAIVTTKADVHCKIPAPDSRPPESNEVSEDTSATAQNDCCSNKGENEASAKCSTVDKTKVDKPRFDKAGIEVKTETDLRTDDEPITENVEVKQRKAASDKHTEVENKGTENEKASGEKEATDNKNTMVNKTRMEDEAIIVRKRTKQEKSAENIAKTNGKAANSKTPDDKTATKTSASTDANKLANNKLTDDSYNSTQADDSDLKPDDTDDVTDKQPAGNAAQKPDDVIYESTYRCWTWENESKRLIVAEWQQMAVVMDRFLFCTSFCMTFIAYFTILVVIPLQYR